MPLTAEEVEQLGRLHVLAEFGVLPAQLLALREELSARHAGHELVAPTLDVQIIEVHPAPREDDEYYEYDDVPIAAAAW